MLFLENSELQNAFGLEDVCNAWGRGGGAAFPRAGGGGDVEGFHLKAVTKYKIKCDTSMVKTNQKDH